MKEISELNQIDVVQWEDTLITSWLIKKRNIVTCFNCSPMTSSNGQTISSFQLNSMNNYRGLNIDTK